MKKITFIALIICFAFWGALSTNAAETRAAACLNQNCPGFLITRTENEPLENSSAECPLGYGCIITYKDRVAHIRITVCSECNTEYKRELLGISQTQSHSRLH
ncbi:MAG: hypothetical protein K1W26_05275 [Acetatifactor sp.]